MLLPSGSTELLDAYSRDVPAPGLARPALLLVDDLDAAPLRRRRPLRAPAAARRAASTSPRPRPRPPPWPRTTSACRCDRSGEKVADTDRILGYRRDVDGVHPQLLWPDYRSTVVRAPKRPLAILPHTLTEVTGPVFGAEPLGDARPRPHPPGRRRAARRADHRRRPRARRRRAPAAATRWSRSGRPTPPAATRTTATATPRRSTRTSPAPGATLTDAEGRYRVRHDQARRVPVAQPRQRLAPGPHPLLAVRPRVRPAAGHPDVLPRRPAASRTTRSSTRCRDERARRAPGRELRPRRDRAGVGARLPASTSCCAGRERTPLGRGPLTMAEGITPSQTVGPFFAIGLPWPDGPTSSPRARRARSGSAGRCSTATASRCPTRSSRPGRPTPTGASTIPTTRAAPTAASAASGAARPTTTGATRSSRVKPGPVPGPDGTTAGAAPRPSSIFARGLLNRVVTRVLLRRRGGGQRRRPGPGALADRPRARRWSRAPTDDGYRFDVRLQGADETVFFAV